MGKILNRSTSITIRISPKHKARLQSIAERDNCTMTDVVAEAIRRYLKNDTRRERMKNERQQALNSESNDTTTDDS